MLGAWATILIADSDELNLRLVEAVLLPLGYQLILARDGEETLAKVKENPSLILLGSQMPKMDGLDLISQLKGDEATRLIPVVLMTSVTEVEVRLKALEQGADDFLTKPIEKIELQARINSLLKVKAYNEHVHHYQQEVETEVTRRTESLKQSLDKIKTASLDTIYRLSRAAEFKDTDTGAHIERMSHYSTALARKMTTDEQFLENILWASPMHDIGKIGIPDRVLQKPGKLDAEEWVIMKRHTVMGAEILKDSDVEFIKLGETIALTHHEKWDGTGYPQGLKTTDTPLAGRIVALADVFDALTSERPYKAPMPIEKAMSIIKEGRGTHFDPDLLDVFLAIEEEIAAELNWWKFMESDSAPF